MSKVRFEIEYQAGRSAELAKLNITRHEDGMIGYGLMKPMLFQQLLDGEAPYGEFAAMTDMWSPGEIEAFLQAALDKAWSIGLRPNMERRSSEPSYAYAEVSPAIADVAAQLRARARPAEAATALAA